MSAVVDGTLFNAEIKTTGFGAGLTLRGDLNPSRNAVARLGVARMTADVSGSALGVSASDTDNSKQATFGLGSGDAVRKAVSIDVSADFSRSKFAGETGTVCMLGAGVTFRF